MITRQLDIQYTEFSSIQELSELDRELVNAAIEAMNGAYSPYSHFAVGAAVRLEGGIIVKGANQENAAFPSGLCAERTAMFAASANYPDKAFESIAITGGLNGEMSQTLVTPCGACRQVMAQYQTKSKQNMSVLLVCKDKILKFDRVDDILPLIFDNI